MLFIFIFIHTRYPWIDMIQAKPNVLVPWMLEILKVTLKTNRKINAIIVFT